MARSENKLGSMRQFELQPQLTDYVNIQFFFFKSFDRFNCSAKKKKCILKSYPLLVFESGITNPEMFVIATWIIKKIVRRTTGAKDLYSLHKNNRSDKF
jgi:hypothetical protein